MIVVKAIKPKFYTQVSTNVFKYHYSAGPWDLMLSQGRYLQTLAKEKQRSLLFLSGMFVIVK